MTAYVFDVDGTLTPSRGAMDPEFRAWFLDFQGKKDTYLVTGSDHPKTLEQLGPEVVAAARMVFNCCGNEVRREGEIIHRSAWTPGQDLIAELEIMLNQSGFPLRTGNHIEIRTGLVNFSVVGRNTMPEHRRQYVEWDSKSGERESMAIRLRAAFPDLDITIAGETGLDIYPLGKDKSQIMQWIEDRPVVFFGDKTLQGGNDFTLACVANLVHGVQDWQDTWYRLKTFNNE